MEARPAPRSLTVAAAAALALSLGAGACLLSGQAVGFLDAAAEPFFVLLIIVGWVLLAWAVIVGAVAVVGLLRTARRRPPSTAEVSLVLGTLAVIVALFVLVPPIGAGSGVG